MARAKVFIRKQGKNVEGDVFPTYDVLNEFGFWTKDIPFPLSGEVKGVDSNDYFDEDGDQEWAQKRLRLKAYNMDVTWIARGSKDELLAMFEKFRSYLLGIEGTGTTFILYSERHHIGMKDVRLNKIYDDVVYDDIDDDHFILQIKMQFKVNDPVSRVFLEEDNTIVAEDGSGLVINGEEIEADRIRIVGTTMYID